MSGATHYLYLLGRNLSSSCTVFFMVTDVTNLDLVAITVCETYTRKEVTRIILLFFINNIWFGLRTLQVVPSCLSDAACLLPLRLIHSPFCDDERVTYESKIGIRLVTQHSLKRNE
jgi:hypothetical protein